MHMRWAMLAGWVLLGGCARSFDEPDGHERRSSPIYEGARETGEPWVVAVHHVRAGTTKLRLCTGAVIAPRVVLTAKHCVFDDDSGGVWSPVEASALTVSFHDDVTSDQTGGGVEEIFTTPGVYSKQDALAGNDIALLRLDADAPVESRPVSAQPPEPGDEVFIAGFGVTEAKDLGRKYSGFAAITQLDSGVFETEGPAGTCTGDSGGPALHTGRGEIIGVTSLGPSSCSKLLSIYTRVDIHAGLIAQALGGAVPGGGAGGSDPVGGQGGESPGEGGSSNGEGGQGGASPAKGGAGQGGTPTNQGGASPAKGGSAGENAAPSAGGSGTPAAPGETSSDGGCAAVPGRPSWLPSWLPLVAIAGLLTARRRVAASAGGQGVSPE